MVICNKSTLDGLKRQIDVCFEVTTKFKDLLDAYIIDFYVDQHWNLLPSSWRDALDAGALSPECMSEWLLPSGRSSPSGSSPLPLGLMALKITLETWALQRDGQALESSLSTTLDWIDSAGDNGLEWSSFTSQLGPDLFHVFRKSVKDKKQHEVARMSQLVRTVAEQSRSSNVVDIGSGVGHLSRLLHYNHELSVHCVDAELDFTESAKKLDVEVTTALERKSLPTKVPPEHITYRLDPLTPSEEFQRSLQQKLPTDSSFVLVGLHTCGDLGPTLVRLFAEMEHSKAIISVGCCYMKLKDAFPLSSYCRELMNGFEYSYAAKELSCHAIEVYCDRLKDPQKSSKLKVHCYRALLEYMLNARDPKLRHQALKTVRNAHDLTFRSYAETASSRVESPKLKEPWRQDELESSSIVQGGLQNWWQVATFYSLRLAFAPLLETLFLLDRCLFLYEKGLESLLVPIFDPGISARNFALIAVKRD